MISHKEIVKINSLSFNVSMLLNDNHFYTNKKRNLYVTLLLRTPLVKMLVTVIFYYQGPNAACSDYYFLKKISLTKRPFLTKKTHL